MTKNFSFLNQIEWYLERLTIIQHFAKKFSFINQIKQCLEHLPIIQPFTKFSSFLHQIERCMKCLPIIQHFANFFHSLTKSSNVWNICLSSDTLQYFLLIIQHFKKISHSLTKLSDVWNIFLSSNTLQYFPHSLTKLRDVYVIGCANWRPTNFLWASEVNEQCRKHRKRVNERCFDRWKAQWVCQLELYKTYLYSRSKDATIKDFKLEILICFNSSIITKPPSANTLHLPPFLYQIELFFLAEHWKH